MQDDASRDSSRDSSEDALRQAEARALVEEHRDGAGGVIGRMAADLARLVSRLGEGRRRRGRLEEARLLARRRVGEAVELASSDLTLAFFALRPPRGPASGRPLPPSLARRRCFPEGAGSRLRAHPEALCRALGQALAADARLPASALGGPVRQRLAASRVRLRRALDRQAAIEARGERLARELEGLRAEHDSLRRALRGLARDPDPAAGEVAA